MKNNDILDEFEKEAQKTNWVRLFIGLTLQSILVFFSISFVTYLLQIYPYSERFDTYIGFPFTFYHEFFVDESLLMGTNVPNLLADCVFAWLLTAIVMYLIKRNF